MPIRSSLYTVVVKESSIRFVFVCCLAAATQLLLARLLFFGLERTESHRISDFITDAGGDVLRILVQREKFLSALCAQHWKTIG